MDINNLWSGYDLNSKKQNSRCLSVNTILEGKYLVGPVLGQGGFGITYVGYDLNMESKIAIKEYFPVELVSRDTTTIYGDHVLSLSGEKSIAYKMGLKKYVAEAQNVSQFSEVPGVVSVKDFFYANETAYIVMEFIDGISLKDYLKEKGGRVSETEALSIMKPILEALVQVHKSGIIHRDISPDNIMLVRNAAGQITQVKLIDFGAARMTEKNDQKSLTIILKHGYAPEEQYRTHGEQGPWTDVYALCAVFYRMLTGETPVPAMDRLFKDELKTFELCGTKVSANMADAILKGLAVKKEDRIQSVQELIKVLYEGGKVKTSVKASASKGSKGIWAAGIAAVAVLAIGGFVLFSGGQKSEENASGTEITVLESEETENNIEQKEEQTENTETKEEILDMNGTEDTLGEQIAFYHPQNSITYSMTSDHTLFCRPDGTVLARGTNKQGQCNVEEWEHIVSVKTGGDHSLGLRKDGIVFAAGNNQVGQCDVTHWTEVVQICAGGDFSLGVTKDGKVLAAGKLHNNMGNAEAAESIVNEVLVWEDVKCVALEYYCAVAGLMKDGTLKIAGTGVEQKLDGWEKVENIWFSNAYIIGMDGDGNIYKADILPPEDAENLIAAYSASHAQQYASYPYEALPEMRQVRAGFADGVDAEGKLVENVIRPDENTLLVDSDYPEEVSGWSNLLAIGYSLRNNMFYGLQEDGTLLEYFHNQGNAELKDFNDLEWVQVFGDGENERFGLIGRTKEQKTLYYGVERNYPGKYETFEQNIVSATEFVWLLEDGTVFSGLAEVNFPKANIKQVLEIQQMMWWLLMEDGTVQASFQNVYGTADRYKDSVQKAAQWTDIVQIAGAYNTLYGLKSDGTLVSTLDNDLEMKNVKQIECFGSNMAALKTDGTVELMWGAKNNAAGMGISSQWTDIEKIVLGETHIVGLKTDGTVVAAGNNHCGQCDVEEWKDIVMIDAGVNCTIGLTASGELLFAGSTQ